MNRKTAVKYTLAFAALIAVSETQAFKTRQIFRPEIYGQGDVNVRVQQPIDTASWIWHPEENAGDRAVFSETRTDAGTLSRLSQEFYRLRCDFATQKGEVLEFDISADERFVLLLDGREILRGPNRGLRNRWHYQSMRIDELEDGFHYLEAVCWRIGEHAPLAQISVRGGFVLKAYGSYDSVLTTGKGKWISGRLFNTRMTDKGASGAFGVGSQCEVRGESLLDEIPGKWSDTVEVRGPISYFAGLQAGGWQLFPSPLKNQMHETKTPGCIKCGPDILKPGTVVPAHSEVSAIWDLGDYYCAYPELRVSGGKGSRIAWNWAECLTDSNGAKCNRSAWEGLIMTNAFGDVFLPDGRTSARFTVPWWRCGRWCSISIRTGDEPLVFEHTSISETRYPVEAAGSFVCDDPFIMDIQKLCVRSLQMCMHEMFFDCPYYEQQMYPGDSRVQFLVSGLFDTDDRMVRNALTLFDCDRRCNGLVPMNCPTRGTQNALGFSCCAAMMYGDYAWQHANRAWLEARLPGLNHTLMGIASYAGADGLLGRTPGWNFVDWAKEWAANGEEGGVPPDGNSDLPNAELNLQYLHAIRAVAIAEEAVGNRQLAAYWREREKQLAAKIKRTFWCEDRALFASDKAKTSFSEHSQCLALLADVIEEDEAKRCFDALVSNTDLARGTIYFKHYLFETYFKFGRADLFFGNLEFWKNCRKWGASTIFENPWIDSRSDCHGWGSHPLWHLHTGVAGVRSAAPWYEKVLVAPQPAHLKFIRSSTPTPKGNIELNLQFKNEGISGTVTLPDSLHGIFKWKENQKELQPGSNIISYDMTP